MSISAFIFILMLINMMMMKRANVVRRRKPLACRQVASRWPTLVLTHPAVHQETWAFWPVARRSERTAA